jgi:benzoyl-CoA reductase/2-hydroxyglutaryl-CoA dehydratase subunit BcrC/BadD/HgdB
MKRPMAVCATSIMCDGNLKSFEVAAREQDVPFIFIDIPFEQGEAGAAYVKGQLETACLELERLTGVHDWRERLTPIAHKVNRAFAIQRECHSLRALSRKNLYHGHEIAGFTFPFHFMLGSDRLIEVLESRLKDLRHGREHNRWFKYPTFTEDCKRLMWLHIVPQYDTPIWKMIDDGVAARVVCDEYSSPYFEDYDVTDPLGSIARRLISHPSNGPIQRRIDHVLKVAREFGVWGIIHYSSWGCHQAAGNVHMLGKVLQENGFRFININGDAVDQKNLSLEQHRTRLEAFLE